MTCAELRAAYLAGEIDPVATTQEALNRIATENPRLNAILTENPKALDEARAAKERLAQPDPPPLCGIPVVVKDNLCTKELRTTCASRILENFVPPYDATAILRLREQHAIILGKSNLDEFAMGSSTENSAFGCSRNPRDESRVPGGSSGGSAVAVAAGWCPISYGSDTGGSVRQPAAFCGVVGLKPTYGRVSRYGLVAFASSLDQIGPFGATVADCALALQAIAGHDPKDNTTLHAPVPSYSDSLSKGVKGLRVAIPREYLVGGVQPEVSEAVQNAASLLREQGASVGTCTLPHSAHGIAVYYILAPAEASSNLARYDGVRYGLRAEADSLVEMYRESREKGFGAEVKRRILMGTFSLSAGYYDAFYGRAQQVRTLIRRDFEEVFGEFDLILGPTTPSTAFGIGEKVDDPLQMYLSDIFTVSVNLYGGCAISVPFGQDSSGLPIGLQLIAPPLGEAKLFQAAAALELVQG
jgi:aspartyl-tRNA(Asn)/glutamyl-tRNA(Gln) amidotransferase subunit A